VVNGVPEIAFPTSEGINFYEFAVSIMANTPYNLDGFSIDSSIVQLTWNGNVDQYYIYRGTEEGYLELIDSTFTDEYLDVQLSSNTSYYYAVQAFDPIKPIPLSNLSSPVEVYVHTPGKVVSVEALSATTVIVNFSGVGVFHSDEPLNE